LFYHELSNFEDEILLKKARNVTPDGDQATNESKDEEKVKEAKEVTKEVKEVQAMVRNITSQDHELLPGSFGSHPVLVQLIANDPEGDLPIRPTLL